MRLLGAPLLGAPLLGVRLLGPPLLGPRLLGPQFGPWFGLWFGLQSYWLRNSEQRRQLPQGSGQRVLPKKVLRLENC